LKNFLKNQFRLRIHQSCPKLSLALRNQIHQVIEVFRIEDSPKNQIQIIHPPQIPDGEIAQEIGNNILYDFSEDHTNGLI